jgi:hypothetical protein
MKMSDRDLKLLVIVLIAIVIACPIFFVLRPYSNRINETEEHIAKLQERQSFLAKLNENRAFYNSSIALLSEERSKIIADFSEGLRDENSLIYLANTERQIPIALRELSFAEKEPTQISESTVDAEGKVVEGLVAKTSITTVGYAAEYEDIKEFLKFILDSDKRTVLTAVSMDQNDENGNIEGVFVLNQYAVTGEGRELAPAVIPTVPHGVDNVFGIPAYENEDED